jgi:hypothetical protein
MDRASWDKRAPLSGALFAILFAGAFFLLPAKAQPKGSDGGSTYVTYFTTHRDALLWRGFVGSLAMIFFIWFIAALAQRMRRQGEDRLAATTFGGGIVLASLGLLQLSTVSWVAWDHGGGLDGNVLKLLYQGSTFAFSYALTVFIGAASVAAWRTKMVPAWLSGYGLVLAVWVLVSGVTYKHSGFFSPTGWFGGIGFLGFLIGTLVASAWLTMNPLGEEATGSAPAMTH